MKELTIKEIEDFELLSETNGSLYLRLSSALPLLKAARLGLESADAAKGSIIILEAARKDVAELNERLHERTQAFLANEVKLMAEIKRLKENLEKAIQGGDLLAAAAPKVLEQMRKAWRIINYAMDYGEPPFDARDWLNDNADCAPEPREIPCHD